jgi:DNA-binding GntR family transcriptional regulator
MGIIVAKTAKRAGKTARPRAKAKTARAPAEMQKGWLHQDAVAVLRKLILSGELPPNERLREIAISERLGVSRTPVREAFRTLAAEGLVELLPNRSVVVTDVNIDDSPDVFTVLGALEALAAAQACERMQASDLTTLDQLQEVLERQFETADRVGYAETNRQIHEVIVKGANNAALSLAWRVILPRAQRVRNLNNLDRRRWAAAVHEHRDILLALKARDGERLRVLMQEHFDNGVESMLKQHQIAGAGKRIFSVTD